MQLKTLLKCNVGRNNITVPFAEGSRSSQCSEVFHAVERKNMHFISHNIYISCKSIVKQASSNGLNDFVYVFIHMSEWHSGYGFDVLLISPALGTFFCRIREHYIIFWQGHAFRKANAKQQAGFWMAWKFAYGGYITTVYLCFMVAFPTWMTFVPRNRPNLLEMWSNIWSCLS